MSSTYEIWKTCQSNKKSMKSLITYMKQQDLEMQASLINLVIQWETTDLERQTSLIDLIHIQQIWKQIIETTSPHKFGTLTISIHTLDPHQAELQSLFFFIPIWENFTKMAQ